MISSLQGNEYTSHTMETAQHMWDNVKVLKEHNFPQNKINTATMLAQSGTDLAQVSMGTKDAGVGEKLDLTVAHLDMALSDITNGK